MSVGLFFVPLLVGLAGTPSPIPASGLPLRGDAAEAFLRTARVISVENLPIGITRPQRMTLSDGTLTLRAAWKTIDEYRPIQRFAKGRPEIGFRDSYKHEIASYELAKLLQLDLVPPTVERTIGGRRGALQLWVEGAITEWERRQNDVQPPDIVSWNKTTYTIRLLHQLVADTDANNVRNILIDRNFHVYVIDFSRAFRLYTYLQHPSWLKRFSRSLLLRLGELTPELAHSRLGRWLTDRQIDTMLKRRDLILERAHSLAAKKGEAAVFFD